MPDPFPRIPLQTDRRGQDYNPAIRLMGRRFFADQTVSELLIELLLVVASPKKIGPDHLPEQSVLPSLQNLRQWPSGESLQYAPKARLNLKLFSFLGASKLDSRHQSHRKHYDELIQRLRSPDRVDVGSLEFDEVIKTLENLFLGFQSVGGQRTWCAAQFLPLASEMMAAETIWRETRARMENVEGWDQALSHFSHTQRLFLARGGELLYLQLCNAVRQDSDVIRQWSQEAGLSLNENERDPNALHAALISAFNSMLDSCPKTVGRLAQFLDTGVEAETAQATDRENNGQSRFTSCGWCPTESWREGTLFAVELLRICEAALDPVERIELLEIGCAIQVLRSLCSQSARSTRHEEAPNPGLGYVWAISDPSGEQPVVKQISRRNVNAIQRLIHDALRNPEIAEQFENLPQNEIEAIYREADSRYGHKLFLGLAKRIGFITPKRGAGARFVFTDKILRFLILALVRPGKRVSYETFKALMRAHYGIAVDDEALGAACEWSGTNRLSTLGGSADEWLIDMLAASGVLIRLSDSCSMVENPFARREVAL